MTLTQTNNTMIPFVPGTQYDGAEVIAFLQQQTAAKKRAPSAYNCFIASKEQREQLRQEQPDISPKDMMTALAGKWKSLSDDDKAAFKPMTTAAVASLPAKQKQKRAPSAYNCFIASASERAALLEVTPDLAPKQMMSALAAKWQLLTVEEKAAFKPAESQQVTLTEKKKRTPSAYNRFIADQERRAQIKLTNPDAPPKEVMRLMAAVWKSLSDEEKVPYQ